MLTGAGYLRSVVAHGGVYAWKDGRDTADTLTIVSDYPQGFLMSYSSTLTSEHGRGAGIIGRQGAWSSRTPGVC